LGPQSWQRRRVVSEAAISASGTYQTDASPADSYSPGAQLIVAESAALVMRRA